MSGGFCGIDPPALGELALRLDWAALDIDSQAGKAHDRLTRHSRWSTADRAGTGMSGSARWARSNADDLRNRITAIIAAQSVDFFGGPPLTSGPWTQYPSPVQWPGPIVPGFPIGNPLGNLVNDADIPWDEIEDWVRGALGIWNGRVDETFPLGRWVFGSLYVNRVVQFGRGRGPLPTIANGWAARQLANTSYFRWLSNPAVQAVGRRVSLGLAVVSTIGDAKVVWDHGNPIDAFEREGAGYVADVARLGFSASTTAFLIAPNPITGGIVIVTGVIWAGAEVVDHWDDITEFWGDVSGDFERGAGWVYDESSAALGAGWDWTTDNWNDAMNWTEDRFHEAQDWANDRVDDIVGIGESGLDQLNRAVDWGSDRLDDAQDWTGDRIDDLADVGSGIVDAGEGLLDAGGGLFDKGKSLLGF